jgi:hypothetical protein
MTYQFSSTYWKYSVKACACQGVGCANGGKVLLPPSTCGPSSRTDANGRFVSTSRLWYTLQNAWRIGYGLSHGVCCRLERRDSYGKVPDFSEAIHLAGETRDAVRRAAHVAAESQTSPDVPETLWCCSLRTADGLRTFRASASLKVSASPFHFAISDVMGAHSAQAPAVRVCCC